MATPRSAQIDLDATPYYHCMVRCVRRAFLCGDDRKSGKSYEHRKAWIRDRLHVLADIFTIDVFAYAVMSNHLHLVVCVDEERAQGLSEDEVIARHGRLFPGTRAQLDELSPPDREARIATWRARLCDLSWMMRGLNETIARQANREDKTGGRFWESRFRCQPLLDEGGLLTCMAYVDLNPVRAGLAKSLDDSRFTSIGERIRDRARKEARHQKRTAPRTLAPFQDQARDSATGAHEDASERRPIPMAYADYLGLLQWSGEALAPGKRGTLDPNSAPALLRQHGFDPAAWLESLRQSRLGIPTRLGYATSLETDAERRERRWCRGVRLARAMTRR